MIEVPEAEVEQDWYFTFDSGQPHQNKYVILFGTCASTRMLMFARFGRRWSMQYPEADGPRVKEFQYEGELK